MRDLTDVKSCDDLTSALRNIDISVPSRIEGRKTHHTETYIVCRLLSTLAGANQLAFPISVSPRDPPNDRPDVFMRTRNAQIGLEITEAIPQQFAALCALAEQEFPDRWFPADLFPWGAGSLTKDEMRALLRQNAPAASGWIDDTPEREWALFMQKVVEIKRTKLAQPGFDKFEQNWLCIYDNLPLPNVHLARAIEILKQLLKDYWDCSPIFDVLLIERDTVIARITANKSEHFVVNELWQPE